MIRSSMNMACKPEQHSNQAANSQILLDAEIVEEDFTANVNGNPFTDGLKISFSLASLTAD